MPQVARAWPGEGESPSGWGGDQYAPLKGVHSLQVSQAGFLRMLACRNSFSVQTATATRTCTQRHLEARSIYIC